MAARYLRGRRLALVLSATMVALTVAIAATTSTAASQVIPTREAAFASSTPANEKGDRELLLSLLAYRKQHPKAKKNWRIAYIMVGLADGYLQNQRNQALKLAKQYGVTLQVFNGAFNPAAQAKVIQDALSLKFDGYIVEPVSGTGLCNTIKRSFLTPKIPVVVFNNPICGDYGYTKGLVGFVGFQDQDFETSQVVTAYRTCAKENEKCVAAAIVGPTGFELVNRFEKGIEIASAMYPQVELVVKQPGDFDAAKSFPIAQDAIRAHPDINLWISMDDKMSGSIVRALRLAGKDPKDSIIFSEACDGVGTSLVRQGLITASKCGFSTEEATMPIDIMVKYLETGKTSPGYVNVGRDHPIVTGKNGIGNNGFLMKQNENKWTPQYP
jgi:ABC-type sugar transport system substrate-binding protein